MYQTISYLFYDQDHCLSHCTLFGWVTTLFFTKWYFPFPHSMVLLISRNWQSLGGELREAWHFTLLPKIQPLPTPVQPSAPPITVSLFQMWQMPGASAIHLVTSVILIFTKHLVAGQRAALLICSHPPTLPFCYVVIVSLITCVITPYFVPAHVSFSAIYYVYMETKLGIKLTTLGTCCISKVVSDVVN